MTDQMSPRRSTYPYLFIEEEIVNDINNFRLTEEEFLKIAEINVEALNEATADFPASKVVSVSRVHLMVSV